MKVTHNELKDVVREVMEELELVPEGLRKKVIRKGKMRKKLFCKPGQKAKGGRCVAMRGAERVGRKRMAKKAAIKRRGKLRRLLKKRAKSMRKRHSFGLK